MAQVVTSFTVDSSSASWTPGPAGILPTQSLQIAVSGDVLWDTGPSKYAQPEGGYSVEGFPTGHSWCPFDSHNTGSSIQFVLGVPSLSLVMIAQPAGVSPSGPTSAGRSDGFWVAGYSNSVGIRTTLWWASDFMDRLPLNPTGPWDTYFVFLDDPAGYANNVGVFTVTATVTDVDDQAAGIVGLPGYEVDEDLQNAEFCSVTGLLAPANRVTLQDGRPMLQEVAPYRILPKQ